MPLSYSGKLADPEFRRARASAAGRASQTPATRVKRVIASVDHDDPEGWAAGIAAALPPLTAFEASAIGKLAAALDARRTSDDRSAA